MRETYSPHDDSRRRVDPPHSDSMGPTKLSSEGMKKRGARSGEQGAVGVPWLPLHHYLNCRYHDRRFRSLGQVAAEVDRRRLRYTLSNVQTLDHVAEYAIAVLFRRISFVVALWRVFQVDEELRATA